MNRHKLFGLIFFSTCVISGMGCQEEEMATLSSFKTPGALLEVEHCVVDGQWKSSDFCHAQNLPTQRAIYVTNLQTGTISYMPLDNVSGKFTLVDIDTTVPGFTSISAAERPMAMAANEAIMVVTSTINSDLSIINLEDKREIAYQTLDKPVKAILWDKNSQRFITYMLDGTLRSLDIRFNCGAGDQVYVDGCHARKEDLKLTWEEHEKLDGRIQDAINDPQKPLAYVSYSNQHYISVISYQDQAGACLNGSAQFPCEIARMGAGFGCSDGVDNDGDGRIDTQDPQCFYSWGSESEGGVGIIGLTECTDGIDNDEDGYFDAFDNGCLSSDDASEADGYQAPKLGTCADGIDNNSDGLIDHDDPSCHSPLDNESDDPLALARVCADGIDNDGDGRIDTEDLGCFGKAGDSESAITESGRGALGIDPRGRWLYVLNPHLSELIVIDLQARKTLDTTRQNPRHEGAGIPVNRLPLSVTGHIRTDTLYQEDKDYLTAERAVAYVASTLGSVQEITIHERFHHYQNTQLVDAKERLTLQLTDINDESSFVGVTRCLNRICTDADLPQITLRTQPVIKYYTDKHQLAWTNELNDTHSGIVDSSFISETWRVTYEGALETVTRTDGYFKGTAVFSANNDFCYVGVHPGDHLILADNTGVSTNPACSAFYAQNASGHPLRLEWRISQVKASELILEITGDPKDVHELPTPECFSAALHYEIRPADTWIVQASTSPVNRQRRVGDICIDDMRYFYGKTRFKFDENPQTAFFSLQMPTNTASLERDSAFEFSIKSGFSGRSFSTGSATTDIKVFGLTNTDYLIISEGSSNSVFVYDLASEGLIQQM